MPEKPKNHLNIDSIRSTENNRGEEVIKEFVALAKELSENREGFPFPGIDPEEYSRMKATEMEFPDYTTPIDILTDKFRSEGVRVFLGQYPESGNVYMLPAGTDKVQSEDAYISPKHLQINEAMDEKIKKLILMDRAVFK